LSKIKVSIAAVLSLLVVASVAIWYVWFFNANNPELDERWVASDESNTQPVDHQLWQTLLDDYLVTDTDSGVNLFDYAGLLDDGRQPLDDYIDILAQQDPLKLNRVEQKAYWINLYNAVTNHNQARRQPYRFWPLERIRGKR